MNELKKFELNNKILENFDELMTFHLNQVEELLVKEIFINPKLYNIISLCTNLKILVIEGDLRMDVNKIVFSICKPEKLETIVLNSVKLPTNKVVQKFTSLKKISLTNITFSDINGFFGKLTNKDLVTDIELIDVDLGKNSVSICEQFTKLKNLSLNNIRNCKFDSLDFLSKIRLKQFNFCNNEVNFDQINSLTKGIYHKNIKINMETSEKSTIKNSFEINEEGKVFVAINSNDIDKFIEEVNLYKINDMYIAIEDNIEINRYIRNLKKVKDDITVAIGDISYLSSEDAKNLRDKLGVKSIIVLENEEQVNSQDYCYVVDEYIEVLEKMEEIVEKSSKFPNDIERFNALYTYIKNNIKYTEDEVNLKDVVLNGKCSYNLYAVFLNSIFQMMNFESKIIVGASNGHENAMWNQVKLDGAWFNFDIASEIILKGNKKITQYKAKLLNDDQFSKNHVVQAGEPEACTILLEQKKRELKNSVKKVNIIEKIIIRLKSIFSLNKTKALPAPEDKNEK